MSVLPSYGNQSTDLHSKLANQLTGLYMRTTLAFNGLKTNFVIGRIISLSRSHLGGRGSIKTRTDANKIKGGPVNANART